MRTAKEATAIASTPVSETLDPLPLGNEGSVEVGAPSLEAMCKSLWDSFALPSASGEEVDRRKKLITAIRKRLDLSAPEFADALGIADQALYKAVRDEQALPGKSRQAILDLARQGPPITLAFDSLDLLTWPKVQSELFDGSETRSIYVFTWKPMPLRESDMMRMTILDVLKTKPHKLVYTFPMGGEAEKSYNAWVEEVKSLETDMKGYVMAFFTTPEGSTDSRRSGQIHEIGPEENALSVYRYASNLLLVEKIVNDRPVWDGFVSMPITSSALGKLCQAMREPNLPRTIWGRVEPVDLHREIVRGATNLGLRYPEVRAVPAISGDSPTRHFDDKPRPYTGLPPSMETR